MSMLTNAVHPLPSAVASHLDAITELERETAGILHLTPNEAPLSPLVARMVSSPLSERYYFGAEPGLSSISIGGLSLRGLPPVEQLVNDAIDVARRRLGADEVSLDCLSGVHAMSSVILSVTRPGDVVMSLVAPGDGGHSATAGLLRRAGRGLTSLPWDATTAQIDLDQVRRQCAEQNVRAIYFDVCDHIDAYRLAGLRDAVGPDVVIIYDASHTLGLIMGGVYPNPLEAGADLITGNTHKTFTGPQKALVAWRTANLPVDVRVSITEDLTSSNHTHHLLALAFALLEFDVFGDEYARATVQNADALAHRFVELGYRVLEAKQGSRLTETHQVHLVPNVALDRRELYERLNVNHISTTLRVTEDLLFLRMGVQDITRRGMQSEQMNEVGELVVAAIEGNDVSEEVSKLVSRFDHIEYAFDLPEEPRSQ